jgi:hypothetical protein
VSKKENVLKIESTDHKMQFHKKPSPWIIILQWLLVVFWMTVIFSFSAQNGEESSAVSGLLADKFICLFIKNFSTFTVEKQLYFQEIVGFGVRKMAHFTEYAILGILLTRAIMNHISRKRYVGCISALVSFLYASMDEFHQYFVDERCAAFSDVLIDSCGAFFGILITLLFFWLLYKKIYRKKIST